MQQPLAEHGFICRIGASLVSSPKETEAWLGLGLLTYLLQ